MKLDIWANIAAEFKDTLVLGNGASIAVHKGFRYSSLFDKAHENGWISSGGQAVFDNAANKDFEFVLRCLSIARFVNEALDIRDSKTDSVYKETRSALIRTVRAVHPSHSGIKHHLEPAYEFMEQFNTVVSLNYDLLVYWAMMEAIEAAPEEHGNGSRTPPFKDCFSELDGGFSMNCFRTEFQRHKSRLVFYPHGGLFLASRPDGAEYKVKATDTANLLDEIVKTWEPDSGSPLFVAEGNSKQKMAAISRSPYLSTVYYDVLPNLGPNVAIYGWSLGENDEHILKQICKGAKKIAVSVFKENEEDLNGHCSQVKNQIAKVKRSIDVFFYDAKSQGCWIQPSTGQEATGVPQPVST